MMQKNTARGRLIFTCVWLGIFAITYIVWVFYLSSVSNKLEDYEKSRPENTAEKIFTEYFLNVDPMKFSSYDDVESKYDVRGSSSEYYYDLTYGKALAFAEYGATADLVTYSVTADGAEFARFALSMDESGMWKLSKIILTASPSNEIFINAPKDAIVTVNGVLLDGECAVSEYMIADSPVFGGDVQKRTMITYRLNGLYSTPALSVKLTEANVQLSFDSEEGKTFSAEKSYIAYLSYIFYGIN